MAGAQLLDLHLASHGSYYYYRRWKFFNENRDKRSRFYLFIKYRKHKMQCIRRPSNESVNCSWCVVESHGKLYILTNFILFYENSVLNSKINILNRFSRRQWTIFFSKKDSRMKPKSSSKLNAIHCVCCERIGKECVCGSENSG